MDVVQDSFRNFLAKSEQVGDVVHQVAQLVHKAFNSHLNVVELANKARKPSNELMGKILKSTSEIIHEIDNFKQKNKTSKFFNHLAGIAESIPAFGWVAVSPTPAPYVKEMMDAGQFYTNKVLVAYKEKDKLHVEWVQSWMQFLQDLQKFIRQYHTTGLTWNPQGGDLDASGNLQGSAHTGSAPPPPPPPSMGNMPPPPPPSSGPNKSKGPDMSADARAALLKDLNQGTDITKGLRKVTLDQRRLNAPSDRSSRSKTPDPRSMSAISQHPPKFEFEGRKWCLEYHDGSMQDNFTIDVAEMNHSINIYKSDNITVTVRGKLNSITVDSCKRLTLAFDDVVSFVEFINCQKVQAYPMGSVPTMTVDKTDSIQLFLRKKSLNVEIISAKSSEINACIVDDATGDYKEYPLPEQLKTVWSSNQFKTLAMDKA